MISMIGNIIPANLNPFLGRKAELAEVNARLSNPECRLLTITGLGGSGKTRLALEAAQGFENHFGDGIFFVALQPLTRSDLLVTTIAQSVGVIFYGDEDPTVQLFNALREKSLLLVLDNFEHLLDGAILVSELLTHAPHVKILITSREALNLQEEWLYPLRGMGIPPSVYSTELQDYDASQLFFYHARRIQPAFDVVKEHQAVVRICNLTEGLPLAIELAASWLKGLSAGQIAQEMQHNLNFLSTTTRNIEERHRSMRAVFNHSWTLLSETERAVFARLSVFRGGFDREAAEQLGSTTLPTLAALTEKSLLHKLPDDRYSIHELLRQFSEEQLEQAGSTQRVRNLHSRYYLAFMREREIDLKGRRQIDGLNEIDASFENIRVAWDWAVQTQQVEVIHGMLEGLLWYGIYRSRQYDVDAMFRSALSRFDAPTFAFLKARITARQCHLLPHDTAPSVLIGRLEQCLIISQHQGDEAEIMFCKLLLGVFLGGIHQQQFDRDRALAYAHETVAYFEASGDHFYLGYALQVFAWSHYYQGDRQTAMKYAQAAVTLRRDIGDRYGVARVLLLMATEAYSIPDYARSEAFNREVREIWSEIGSWNFVAFVNVNLTYLAIFRGDFAESHALANEALSLAKKVNIRDDIAYALSISGVLASLEERYQDAWQLLTEAAPLATFTSSIEALEWGWSLAAAGLEDFETARAMNQRSLRFTLRLNAPSRYLWHLPVTSLILAHTGDAVGAAELLGLVFTHPASALPWMEQWPPLMRLRTQLEDLLGTEQYIAAWKRGRSRNLETVVHQIIAWYESGQDAPPSLHAAGSHSALVESLTPREIDVLSLLSAGLTNPQIADRLVIGAGTVKTHTLSIYRKLDVANRTQAIVRAQELGLLPT